jgi:hypothetical protein
MATLLPVREIDRRMREHPLRLHFFTLEQRFSLWTPLRRSGDNRTYLTAFVYSATALAGEGAPTQLKRPSAQIVIDPADAAFVAVVLTRYHDFAGHISTGDVVGVLRRDDVPANSIEELETRRDKLRDSYDAILPLAWTQPAQLSAEQINQLRLFQRRFDLMMEPCLQPFYKALNPDFFAWLQQFAA